MSAARASDLVARLHERVEPGRQDGRLGAGGLSSDPQAPTKVCRARRLCTPSSARRAPGLGRPWTVTYDVATHVLHGPGPDPAADDRGPRARRHRAGVRLRPRQSGDGRLDEAGLLRPGVRGSDWMRPAGAAAGLVRIFCPSRRPSGCGRTRSRLRQDGNAVYRTAAARSRPVLVRARRSSLASSRLAPSSSASKP